MNEFANDARRNMITTRVFLAPLLAYAVSHISKDLLVVNFHAQCECDFVEILVRFNLLGESSRFMPEWTRRCGPCVMSFSRVS